MGGVRTTRADAAVQSMMRTRAQFTALLLSDGSGASTDRLNAYPRSKTFRWLLSRPVGRWLGSMLLTGAASRLHLGRVLQTWLVERQR